MNKEEHKCDNVNCNHNNTKGLCCLFNPDNCKYRQLQKENIELKDVIEGYKKIAKWCDKCDKIAELEKENAELKAQLESERDLPVIAYQQGAEKQKKKGEEELKKWKDGIALKDEEIGCIETEFNTFKSEAKEIIREFVEWATWQGSNCPNFKSIQDKAEQFLSEVEK